MSSYLTSYSRLLDGFVSNTVQRMTSDPAEVADRVDAIFGSLAHQRLDEIQLTALLSIAVDRLATSKIGAPE
jgi:hypothetical protein